MAMLTSIAIPVFAESAPVYDVDSVPQQYESSDQQEVAPPPPPSSGGQQGAYVPGQSSDNQPAFEAESAMPVPKGTLDQRMRRLEQQVSNMQSSDRAAKLDALQEQVQALRGQVEQLTHDLQQMQAQQKAMYGDLDKRLGGGSGETAPAADQSKSDKKSSTTAVPAVKTDDAQPSLTPSANNNRPAKSSKIIVPVASKDKTDNQPNVAEEQQIYQAAYDFIKAKKYNDAVTALQGMLKKYPTGQFAANAHYWLGELYGLMNKHDQALKEFGSVINSFPDSPRVSDAQLKVGLLYAANSQWSDAKSAFRAVINHYPGTASARLASEQLKQIKQAGH